MKEIVVCGESLVDLVLDAEGAATEELAPLQPVLGGGPFNSAIALGRLGSAVSFCSRISTDYFGDQLVASLRSAGVNLALVQRDSAPTSLALATIGAGGGAAYSFYLEGTADRLVTDPGALPDTVGALAFGTLSLVTEPGASVYEQMMHTHHAAGRVIMLDPNIRSSVIGDADAYRDRLRSWLPSIDILKSSDDDADWIAQGENGTGPRDWLDAGVTAVVITRGSAGITVTTAAGSVDIASPSVTAVDTIGAGDTVVGALLHWLRIHDVLDHSALAALPLDQWQAAAEFAARAAAITVSRPGADPPWAGELAGD